jgi:peptide/nickel transport system ATP-binding protein
LSHEVPPIIALESVGWHFVKSLDVAGRIARALGADLRDEIVHAVDDVSLAIEPGEVVGLVGESGCGKSTLGRMVARILPPSAGTIRFKGRERPSLEGAEAKAAALAVQMISRDPMSSLNPRKRVRDIIGEAPRVHGLVSAAELDDFLDGIMIDVGLDPSYKRRYPHQFSGGQRARIGISRCGRSSWSATNPLRPSTSRSRPRS